MIEANWTGMAPHQYELRLVDKCGLCAAELRKKEARRDMPPPGWSGDGGSGGGQSGGGSGGYSGKGKGRADEKHGESSKSHGERTSRR